MKHQYDTENSAMTTMTGFITLFPASFSTTANIILMLPKPGRLRFARCSALPVTAWMLFPWRKNCPPIWSAAICFPAEISALTAARPPPISTVFRPPKLSTLTADQSVVVGVAIASAHLALTRVGHVFRWMSVPHDPYGAIRQTGLFRTLAPCRVSANLPYALAVFLIH